MRTRILHVGVMIPVALFFLVPTASAERWCFGTGGGGSGASCNSYPNDSECTNTVCSQSETGTTANDAATTGCAEGASCTQGSADPSSNASDSSCTCSCYDTAQDCNAALPKAGGPKFEPIVLANPLGITDLRELAARGIQMITGIAGSIALLMFVWGGFLMVTSAGSAEKAKKAKSVFVWSSIGLALIFGSYALLSTLLKAFTGRV